MRADNRYQTELQEARGPDDPKQQRQLERQMGFSYPQEKKWANLTFSVKIRVR